MKTKEKNIQVKPSKKKGESMANIVLENELTIFSIESMKDKIIETVMKYDHVEFALKNVNNVDMTFIQLLYSVKKTAESLNKKVSFNVDLSDDIKSLLNNSDLSKVLI